MMNPSPSPSPPLRLARPLVLIGFMGSGKSSVGRLLAVRLGAPFWDTDALIVEAAGRSIPEIFAREGEARFRDYEGQVLAFLVERAARVGSTAVIATGGGIVGREGNAALLRKLGRVVCLKADEAVIFERVSRNKARPLLQTADPRATVAELLAARAPLYAAAADFTVETGGKTHAQVADEILLELARRQRGETGG